MINCKKATELASNSLDKELGLMQRINLKLHLFICHTCRNYARQIFFLRSAARQLDDHVEQHTEHQLSDKARESIKGKMNRHD